MLCFVGEMLKHESLKASRDSDGYLRAITPATRRCARRASPATGFAARARVSLSTCPSVSLYIPISHKYLHTTNECTKKGSSRKHSIWVHTLVWGGAYPRMGNMSTNASIPGAREAGYREAAGYSGCRPRMGNVLVSPVTREAAKKHRTRGTRFSLCPLRQLGLLIIQPHIDA